jgi:hypothetical protein
MRESFDPHNGFFPLMLSNCICIGLCSCVYKLRIIGRPDITSIY